MAAPLYIGVDGGQSGTRAMLADAQGHVLAMGKGPACDHLTGAHGYEINAAAIHGAIGDALKNANAQPDDVIAIGMGLTTAPREIEAQPQFERMVREIVQPQHIWIVHDAATNLAGATAGEPGVMVIGGSGSIAYGINDRGGEAMAGGLGYLMGDDGSAWWIGIQALQAAARAADGRGEHTELLPFVLEHYQIPTIRHLHLFLYGDSFSRSIVSGITPDVVRIAKTDEVAAAIITRAAQHLAALVIAVVQQIHTPNELVHVYPTGGVFRAGDAVLTPFAQAFPGAGIHADIRTPQFEPVVGALIRSYQTAGIKITPDLLTNVRATQQTAPKGD